VAAFSCTFHAFIPGLTRAHYFHPSRRTSDRQLDSSPGKGFGEGDGSGPGSLGAGPASIPKLNDLDIALGLGGATSVPKKVCTCTRDLKRSIRLTRYVFLHFE
jgi:hypothetical protein